MYSHYLAYSAPQTPSWWGRVWLPAVLSARNPPRFWPYGPCQPLPNYPSFQDTFRRHWNNCWM